MWFDIDVYLYEIKKRDLRLGDPLMQKKKIIFRNKAVLSPTEHCIGDHAKSTLNDF